MSSSPASLLRIRTGENFEDGVAGSGLLLGFSFVEPGLAPPASEPAGIAHITTPPLSQASAAEGWWYAGAVEHSCHGQVRLAECADFTALIIEVDEAGKSNLRQLVAASYRQILTKMASARHTCPIRIWNFLDRINAVESGEERYRQFSSGRADAFAEFCIADAITPVGTAIGTQDSGKLVIVVLASDMGFQVVENPRQVSAYHYPKAYGPDSPKFSRSGLLGTSAGPLLLVSGTAAVVGHESAHPFDTARQLEETLVNLQVLTAAAHPQFRAAGAGFKPGDTTVLRAYLRDESELELVQNGLAAAWGKLPQQMLFLRGDICRSELTIEIEAVIIPD